MAKNEEKKAVVPSTPKQEEVSNPNQIQVHFGNAEKIKIQILAIMNSNLAELVREIKELRKELKEKK